MKKLLLLTTEFPFSNYETFLLDEITQLRNYFSLTICPIKQVRKMDGFKEMYSFSFRPSKSWKFFVIHGGKALSALIFLLRHSSGKKLFRNLYYINILLGLYDELRHNPPEHIHAYWASSPTFIAMMLSSWLDVPFSFSAHRYDILENDFLREKVANAKFVRSVSLWGKKIMAKTARIHPSEKISVIHLGIKIPDYLPEKDFALPHKAITPAGFIKRKGQIELINYLIRQSIPSLKLIFCGNGPLKKRAESLVKKNKLRNIQIRSKVPYRKLLDFYSKQSIDLLILPTKNEAIPISVVEAMAYGVLPITFKVGGIGELMSSDYPGLLDPESWDKLEKTITNFQKLVRYRNINYKKVKKQFNCKTCAKSLALKIKN